MLGDEFLTRPRLSRIYYDGKYFAYPLTRQGCRRAASASIESARCAVSYLAAAPAAARRARDVRGLGDGRFGRRLYDGSSARTRRRSGASRARRSGAEWAAQRIKNFSLGKALRRRSASAGARHDADRGVPLSAARPWADVGGVRRRASRSAASRSSCGTAAWRSVTTATRSHERRRRARTARRRGVPVDAVLSSIPLSELVLSLDPPPPRRRVAAAERLRYRRSASSR